MTTNEIGIGNPTPEEYGRVGELVYLVDPYIYPALFGSPEAAKMVMPTLMGIENSPFSPGLVHVARINGVVAGILVLYIKPFESLPELSCFYAGELVLPDSAKDVCENYLIPMCKHVASDEAYIPCIATEPACRGRGVASALIDHARQLANGLPLTLDVLKDNEKAIRLYENQGFIAYKEIAGYSFAGNQPKVISMKTA